LEGKTNGDKTGCPTGANRDHDERSLQLREILAVARYRARAGIASGAMAAMIKSGEIRARLDAS